MSTPTLPVSADRYLSADTSQPLATAQRLPTVKGWPLAVALTISVGLSAIVWTNHGAQSGILLLLGLGLGLALFHSRFGFTSAWRQLVAVGNGTGLRAHTLLLGTTATLFALIIGTDSGLFGITATPASGPLGIGLIAGAFLFGIGMQVAGACASGTLFAVGSGQSAIMLTLGGFVIGSVLFTWQWPLVRDLPALPPFILSDHVGWWGSWVITIAILAAIFAVSRVIQRRRMPPPIAAVPSARGLAQVVRGSWPLAAGALVIAILGAGVLLVSGGPWGVTSAFAVWGAKILQAFGFQPQTWAFWQQPDFAAMLSSPVLADKTSLTNFGIMLGAAIAAAAAGAWKLHRQVPWRTAVGAVGGGVLLGVGARLAGGCNIGAYLAGIASGSLHGWAWGLAALAGTWIGLKARTWFGLSRPRPRDSVC